MIMTREEKLQAIEDMGVNVEDDCTINNDLRHINEYCEENCGDCWIKSLEY